MRQQITLEAYRIMAGNRSILDQMLDRQARMFRIAQDPTRYGLTLKIIAMDSGLGYDSLRNYASGHTVMPITAMFALIGVLPDELLSLLLPDGRQIVKAPEGLDHDELEAACLNYIKVKGEAHHPASPAGREISPCEDEKLRQKAAGLALVA
jgi:hypothetical protein